MTLPAIKVHLREVDTRGVVRSRIGKEEYIRVDEVCAALPISKDRLFKRLALWQAAEAERLKQLYAETDKDAEESKDAEAETRNGSA